ncbi:hypothetical protein MAR_005092 [Mya arenaria]|uniref:Uncharacterized protein n=1 Tax=Mya arenaria TaxID=6604 RepID=A0ABY7F056_MYAAR|nr:hypothetical protein MAR_005092 [Mya arenaria]
MITDKHFSDLDEKGYTVVENVVGPDDCDQAISEYRKWLGNFGPNGFPVTYKSLLWNYNVGHLDTTSERFQEPDDYWLHIDVTPGRVGVHAYQGALYLEEQKEEDWIFLVF